MKAIIKDINQSIGFVPIDVDKYEYSETTGCARIEDVIGNKYITHISNVIFYERNNERENKK